MSFFNKKPNNCDKKLEKFEKKAPIWSHFSPSSVDISKAICNYCGGVYKLLFVHENISKVNYQWW